MLRLIALTALAIVTLPLQAQTSGVTTDEAELNIPERLPREHWDYMDGYRYQYAENCVVVWHVRTATFLGGSQCPELTNEKLMEDALKSIRYAKSRSNARNFMEYYEQIESETKAEPKQPSAYSINQSKQDAKQLWQRACVDAKNFKSTTFSDMARQYPGLDFLHAGRLFSNARNTVAGMGGMVNCAEQANYFVDLYTSDVDIRATR